MRNKLINLWYRKELSNYLKPFILLEKLYAFFSKRKRNKIIELEKALFANAKAIKELDNSQNLAQNSNQTPKPEWRLGTKIGAKTRQQKTAKSQKILAKKLTKNLTILQANRHIEQKIPLIIVGNVSLGGTGKTPVVAELTNFLQTRGFKVAIIMRGYGGKPKTSPQKVTQNSSVAEVGDEALMLFNETRADIFVDKIRAKALDMALSQGAQIVISDDGLQHYGIVAQIKFLVVDSSRMFGNSRQLPIGALRENPKFVMPSLTGILQNSNGAYEFETTQNQQNQQNQPKTHNFTLVAKGWINGINQTSASVPFSKNTHVNALAAIGNPERFFKDLQKEGLILKKHIFKDHAKLDAKYLASEKNPLWVMTNKDAVKLSESLTQNHWIYQIRAEFQQDFYEDLLKKIYQITG